MGSPLFTQTKQLYINSFAVISSTAGKEKAGKIFTSQCLLCLRDYRTFFTGTSISIEQNTLGRRRTT